MPSLLPNLFAMQRALNTRGKVPFGVGGGGAPTPLDATAGGIQGRVTALLDASQTQNDDVSQTLSQIAYFPAGTQARAGSVARIIQSLFVDIAVSGDLPEGHTAASLKQFLIGSTYIQPEIGGVPQLQIPLAAAVDTRRIDRSFGLRARLNPGDFQSLYFRWTSDAIALPLAYSLAPDPEYTVQLIILSVFSEPLRSPKHKAAA